MTYTLKIPLIWALFLGSYVEYMRKTIIFFQLCQPGFNIKNSKLDTVLSCMHHFNLKAVGMFHGKNVVN